MTFETALGAMVVLFPVSEAVLGIVKRAKAGETTLRDRGSMRLLWIVITCAVVAAVLVSWRVPAAWRIPVMLRLVAAPALLLGGLALRWVAILTLGRFFTPNVAIHGDHRLVESGPYRFVRHPSYTGLLVAFVGLGVYLGNWLSLLVVILPVLAALLHRIRIEEAALREALGAAYDAYCARTKRLIPGVL